MKPLNRFPLALALGLFSAGAATQASPARAEELGAGAQRTLAGSWIVNVTPSPETGIPPIVNLASFTKDGRVVNVDPTEGAAVGEWSRTPDGKYRVTFMGFTTLDGAILRVKVRGTGTVAEDGQAFTSSFRTEILDGDGNVLMAFEGTVEGTRFGVEPL